MSRWLIRIVIFLVGSAALLAIGLAALLARGPIDLGFLRPTLERALSSPEGSFRVELATVALAWDAEERQTEIRGTGVRVIGGEGQTVVEIPAVDVLLAPGALLLRWRIVPVDVDFHDARLTIVRAPDGTFDLGMAGGAPAPDEGVDVRAIVDDLARRAATEPPLRLSAHGAEIAIVGQGSADSWRLTGANLMLRPDAHGVAAELAGQLEVAAHRVPIRGTARYRVGSDRGTVTLGFRRLLPEIVGDLPLWDDEGPPDWATALHMPLDGALVMTLDSALRPRLVHGRLRGAAGTVRVLGDIVPPIEVTDLRLRGRLDVANRRLDAQQLALDLGSTHLHAAGGLSWTEDGAIALEATTAGEQFPLELLDHWWPPSAAPAVRRWVVDSRRGGIFTTAELELDLRIEAVTRRTSLRLRRGKARFDRVGMEYDERLPPVTNANGSVALDDRGWTIRADRGRVGAMELAGATGLFPLEDARGARPRLTAALRGSLREALAIVDREPFGYARALGVTPDAMKGFLTARLTIEPPAQGSSLAVALSGDAHMTQVATDAVLGGAPVRDGDVKLTFEPGRFRATGTARVADGPVTFTWSLADSPKQKQIHQATVSGRLSSEARRFLGLDLVPWVDGPMDGEARLATSQGNGTVDLTLRLDDTRIEPGIARLAKPAGAPGRASARLTLASNVVTRVDRISLQAGPTTVTGSAARRNGWDDVRLQADIAGVTPDAERGKCALAIDQRHGGHAFRLTSDDAGALLAAIGGGEGLRDGTLVLAGVATPAGAGTDATATLDIRKPLFTDRSVLRRVIALGSLSSLASAFTGPGLRFDRVGAALRWHYPTVTVTDGVMQGSALTVVVDGTIDQPSATLGLRGTAIPSYYGLNTAVGHIPIVGNLIGSGNTKAIQAIDFTVGGPIHEPRVQVSPLSAIAPGVLRDVVRKLKR